MTDHSHPPASSGLVTVRADDDSQTHLAGAGQPRSLCGRLARTAATRRSFRVAGCSDCLAAARDEMHTSARDSDQGWINLTRLVVAAG